MLRIHGRNNSINVQKVMWAVAELGVVHQRIDAGGAFGGLDGDDYGRLNRNRKIPTVVDDDGSVVWESNACVRYLAARYGAGSLWPEAPGPRAQADQWMDWQQTTIHPEMTPVFWGLIRTPEAERDHTLIAAATERLGAAFAILDDHLAGRAFVAGEALTMGDIPLGCACYRYHQLPIKRPALAHLSAWYDRLQARPAFQSHVMIPLT